jgi:hypothetical protein
MPSLHYLGRLACSQACESALDARYLFRPPLRAISRLTVEGALPIMTAIWRIDALTAMPREISSRSARLSARRERRRIAGAIPPLEEKPPHALIQHACLKHDQYHLKTVHSSIYATVPLFDRQITLGGPIAP